MVKTVGVYIKVFGSLVGIFYCVGEDRDGLLLGCC